MLGLRNGPSVNAAEEMGECFQVGGTSLVVVRGSWNGPRLGLKEGRSSVEGEGTVVSFKVGTPLESVGRSDCRR